MSRCCRTWWSLRSMKPLVKSTRKCNPRSAECWVGWVFPGSETSRRTWPRVSARPPQPVHGPEQYWSHPPLYCGLAFFCHAAQSLTNGLQARRHHVVQGSSAPLVDIAKKNVFHTHCDDSLLIRFSS